MRTNIILDEDCRKILDRAPRGFNFSEWVRDKVKTDLKAELDIKEAFVGGD